MDFDTITAPSYVDLAYHGIKDTGRNVADPDRSLTDDSPDRQPYRLYMVELRTLFATWGSVDSNAGYDIERQWRDLLPTKRDAIKHGRRLGGEVRDFIDGYGLHIPLCFTNDGSDVMMGNGHHRLIYMFDKGATHLPFIYGPHGKIHVNQYWCAYDDNTPLPVRGVHGFPGNID